jgi:phosphoglycerate dehydrogenase-like enzyme
LTWGLIQALLRHIPLEYENLRGSGKWQLTVGRELAGKHLGVIGLGRLGSRVARVGLAFGMKVSAWSKNLTVDRCDEIGVALAGSLDELLQTSDIATIHLVLSDRTRGLIGARELGLMKHTALLINTSRGPIVEEAALIAALKGKRIAGAGLDVFDQEPLPQGHAFRALDNVVATPHLGYVTEETYRICYGEAVENIAAWLSGKPIRVIAPA